MMRGLIAAGANRIDLDGNEVAELDWFDEVSSHLLAVQNLG